VLNLKFKYNQNQKQNELIWRLPIIPYYPVKALDCIITDDKIEYLDLYSGHGVNFYYTNRLCCKIKDQLDNSFTRMQFKIHCK
jgi:hypothetical protein